MARLFSKKQRRLLYIVAEGRCETCREPLNGAWCADHIIEYACGGETDLPNGQALCIDCHDKKTREFNTR